MTRRAAAAHAGARLISGNPRLSVFDGAMPPSAAAAVVIDLPLFRAARVQIC